MISAKRRRRQRHENIVDKDLEEKLNPETHWLDTRMRHRARARGAKAVDLSGRSSTETLQLHSSHAISVSEGNLRMDQSPKFDTMVDLYLKIEVAEISYDEARLYGKPLRLQCISVKNPVQSHFQSICQNASSLIEKLNSRPRIWD